MGFRQLNEREVCNMLDRLIQFNHRDRTSPCSSPNTSSPKCGYNTMTPEVFIAKWRAAELKERSAAQEHFIDLCRLLGEPTPAEADPTGETYCFEKGARKETGGDGWADVWKRHCFAWEYKGQRANLDAAFAQLRQYALALENPPLLIVSDLRRFRIRTHWTNSVSKTHEFEISDLADAAVRDKLKWALSDPERLRPDETRQALTERAATAFALLAQALRERGHDPQAVAHFINRLVFCMFAEDVGLLPNNLFTRMLEQARQQPEEFAAMARDLFAAMATGGRVGFEPVAWFNGGLFADDAVLPLEKAEIDTVLQAATLEWSEIDPSILGTLFERGLDPDKRTQLGAHYTDRDKIMRIVEPVVIRPWLAEWEQEKEKIAAALKRAEATRSATARTRQRSRAKQRKDLRDYWWRHDRSGQNMFASIGALSRYIVTPRVAKHRLFAWLDARIYPDCQLIVIARDDDTTFGILHSRFHEAWSLRLGTWLGKGNGPRYTPTTTFETFPFPEGLSPDIPASDYANDPCAVAIAEAARRLVELRDHWLNPPEWVEWVDEPVSGYPKHPVPRDEAMAKELKKRTLTNLYNARPQWLADAHAALDVVVAEAYGWDVDIAEDEVLPKLLALNLADE